MSFHHGVAIVVLVREDRWNSLVGVRYALIDSAGRYLIEPTDLELEVP